MSLRMSRKKTHRLNYKLCCVQKNNKMVINSDLTSDWMVSVANGRHISANETVSNDDYTKCSKISDCRWEKWHYFVHINIVCFWLKDRSTDRKHPNITVKLYTVPTLSILCLVYNRWRVIFIIWFIFYRHRQPVCFPDSGVDVRHGKGHCFLLYWQVAQKAR